MQFMHSSVHLAFTSQEHIRQTEGEATRVCLLDIEWKLLSAA